MAHADNSTHRRPSRCTSARVATVAGYPELRYAVQCPACHVHLPAESIEDAGEIARRHRAGVIVGIELDGDGGAHADPMAVPA